jgi:hypothetical protein
MSAGNSGRTTGRHLAAPALLTVIVVGQVLLDGRLLHNGTNFDEGVYLAALDALRHGQQLGSDVFAAQFPGFYDLLRVAAIGAGASISALRVALIAIFCLGTVGAWLIGRRFGGTPGAALTAALFVVAPPLDLFGSQIIADTPALALTVLAVGLATICGPIAAVAAGAAFALALSVKLTAVTAVPALVWYLRRRTLLAISAAGVAGLVLLALHGAQLASLWESAVRYHENARSTAAVIPHPHRQILDQIPHRTPFFWLAITATLLAVTEIARRRRLDSWPLWLWTALTVVFLLLHAPLHYNHLILFPGVLSIAAGATLAPVIQDRPALWALAALVLTAAYLQQWHRVEAGRFAEPSSNVAAARALRRLIPPGSLTIDDRPIISFRARRQVVGPLVDLAALRFETKSLTDQKVLSRLPAASAVVVSRELRHHPRILRALVRSFRLRYDRGGVRIWVRR